MADAEVIRRRRMYGLQADSGGVTDQRSAIDRAVVYEILDEEPVVLIHRAAPRADVYRPR